MLVRSIAFKRATLTKHLLVALVMALVGAGIGAQRVYAESKSVWVAGIGTVGTASTNGNTTSGTYGSSTSSHSLHHLRAHIKIWHTGNILQGQHNRTWSSSLGGSTNTLTSSGFGDYSVTLHEFRFTPGHGTTTVYTSMNGGWSCANAWNQYQNGNC